MKRSLKSSIKSLNILGILLAFLVLCVIMAIASPAFLKQTNLLNILQQISINFTIAIGMTFVILIGGIDLSVGSITALTGMFVAIMMKNWNIPRRSGHYHRGPERQPARPHQRRADLRA